jgi:hypothetical protein
VRREIVRHTEFTATVEQIVEVNERICEARPTAGPGAREARGRKRGLSRALAEERSPPR